MLTGHSLSLTGKMTEKCRCFHINTHTHTHNLVITHLSWYKIITRGRGNTDTHTHTQTHTHTHIFVAAPNRLGIISLLLHSSSPPCSQEYFPWSSAPRRFLFWRCGDSLLLGTKKSSWTPDCSQTSERWFSSDRKNDTPTVFWLSAQLSFKMWLFIIVINLSAPV